jgi:hypothetical protein
MKVILDFKGKTIIPFLHQNVSPGSTIYTDGLKIANCSQRLVGFSEVATALSLRNQGSPWQSATRS